MNLSTSERERNISNFELKIKVSKPLSLWGRGLERGYLNASNLHRD
jgi:hypothetical protein